MGLRKVKICMETVIQKDCKKRSVNFEDFFALHEKFINDKKLEGLRDRTIEEHINNIKFLKSFATQTNKNYAVVDEDF